MYINVEELVHNSRWQALGMRLIADRYNMPAALGYMDLSVEAEAFGSTIIYKPNETPTVTGRIISSYAMLRACCPRGGGRPHRHSGRGYGQVLRLINDRPVFANCIGPFSLAGRLMDVGDIMLQCYAEPETVELVLRKATDFIKDYIRAFKSVGVNGVMMAEPLAGILSPELIGRFSSPYVKEIVDELQDRSFMFIYHNCGPLLTA
jgi:uroporphyrinogen decarboxylase